MKPKTKFGAVLLSIFAALPCGCADAFFGFGDALGDMSSGIDEIEDCVTPLEPADLNEVFARAADVLWDGPTAELSDQAQEEMAAYYVEHLATEVLPAYYLNERIYELGPLAAGDLIEVEPLRDLVSDVWFYDGELTFCGGQTHDLDGHRRTLSFRVRQDSPACYLRLNFFYLSKTGQPVVRLTRRTQQEQFAPRGQTVVLNFAGHEGLTFRSGNIKPTDVAALDDAGLRARATQAFRETFARYDLTVLTDEDPAPEAPFSVIHIGPADPELGHLGYAETIDYPNAIPDDIALVDTNSKALQAAGLLGPEAFGTAVGKVAAHEMGHLLGLVHVSNPEALMTGAGCQGAGIDPRYMLDREFTKSPVSSFTSDFFIGFQDAEQYLLDVLGPAGETDSTATQTPPTIEETA